MAPMEVVVVVEACVEHDPGQLSEIVETVVDVDDRIEGEPAIPDLLDELAARPRYGQVDVERGAIGIG